uniref:Bm11866 n=1 Tax=Brugia malayi TaxID=6279 RepID=A0A1I9GAC9_BRUMA|nr:Bm11866 [Brugia malayi]
MQDHGKTQLCADPGAYICAEGSKAGFEIRTSQLDNFIGSMLPAHL